MLLLFIALWSWKLPDYILQSQMTRAPSCSCTFHITFPLVTLLTTQTWSPFLLLLMLQGTGLQRLHTHLNVFFCIEALHNECKSISFLTVHKDPQIMQSVLTLFHLLSWNLPMLKHGNPSFCTYAQIDRVRINCFRMLRYLLKCDAYPACVLTFYARFKALFNYLSYVWW